MHPSLTSILTGSTSTSTVSTPDKRSTKLLYRMTVPFIWSLALLLFVVLSVNALFNVSGDFEVYHRAGRNLLAAEPIYALQNRGAFSFKYPPWLALLLAPLSVLPFRVSELLWRYLIIFCLFYVWKWTARTIKNPFAATLALPMFWGVWMQNVVTGQIAIPFLALALWAYDYQLSRPRSVILAIFVSFSAKIFHLVAILGLPRNLLRLRYWLSSALVLALLSIPALWTYRHSGWLIGMCKAFIAAAASGDARDLGGGMYGLPTLWTKWKARGPVPTNFRLLGFIPSLILASAVLLWLRKKCIDSKPSLVFISAIALSAVIHPLTFIYSFAWTYPAQALALQQLAATRHYRTESDMKKPMRTLLGQWLIVVGTFCLVVLNTKFSSALGLDFFTTGYPIKAIGTFLMCIGIGVLADGDEKRAVTL